MDLFQSAENQMVIGIDISSHDVIMMALQKAGSEVIDVTGKVKKISLDDDDDSAQVQQFHDTFHAHIKGLNADQIGVLKRIRKGKFTAGATSFKTEALIQNYRETLVQIVTSPKLKAFLKKHPLPFSPPNKYQEKAFGVAWYLLHQD
jgi:hypothetical protein